MRGHQLHAALDSIHAVMEAKLKAPTLTEELLYVIAEALVELVISDDGNRA